MQVWLNHTMKVNIPLTQAWTLNIPFTQALNFPLGEVNIFNFFILIQQLI